MNPSPIPLARTRALAFLAPLLVAAGCAGSTGDPGDPGDPGDAAGAALAVTGAPAGEREALTADVRRIRKATARFRDLDGAVAAGYARHVARCLEKPPEGGMGYHHENPALVDDRLDVDRPEILVYEQTEAGTYELTGVEYIVPFSMWSRDEPPTILGRSLKRAPVLEIWYLHVWVWRANPSGLFADWNPTVSCRPLPADAVM